MKLRLLSLFSAILISVVASFGQAGTLDNNFDGDGIKLVDISGSVSDGASSVVIQPDGKIVLLGSRDPGSSYIYDFALVRLNPDGSLDNTFGTGGTVSQDFFGGSNEYCRAGAIQADGKFVMVGGYTLTNAENALARFNSDGSIDTTFGFMGMLINDLSGGGYDDVANGVAIQPDGKIVTVGEASDGTDNAILVARYTSSGSFDNSFSFDGQLTTDLSSGHDYGNAVAIQSDGKILVAGSAYNGTNWDMTLVRYNTDGTLDNSFGTNGVSTNEITGSGYGSSGQAIAIQTDGKIIVGGYMGTSGGPRDYAVVRFNTDGSLDNSFNFDGILSYDFESDADECQALTIQPDGKIIAAGYATVSGVFQFSMVRYLTDGSLDNTFGSGGKVATDLNPSSGWDYAQDVALQSDGLIVLAGSGSDDFGVARYLNDLNIGIAEFFVENNVLIYPNPIVQTTTLQFELLHEEILSLKLFTVDGKEVKTILANHPFSFGQHEVKIDLTGVGSGAYNLVIANANGYQISIKVVKG